MKIAFAPMGTSQIAFKQLIEKLGHVVAAPPPPSKETLSLGVKYAPEFACIPFKMVLGSYIQALSNGAEIIITSGGLGPCRAGLYGLLHERILQSLGYKFKLMVFDPPLKSPLDFVWKVRQLIKPSKTSWLAFYRELKTAWFKLKVLDNTEFLSHRIRPYEIKKGTTTAAFRSCLEIIERAQTIEQLAKAEKEAERILRAVPQDHTLKPLKVGLIGEIYVVLEPFINMDIEIMLGEAGVETHRSIYLTGYTRHNVMANGEKSAKEIAKPYLQELVGGHGLNSIAETICYAQNGFDGVIQLAPFTCIPEIVAKSILPKVSRDWGIPVYTVTLDELTGKAGMQTRLEAFIDILTQRRHRGINHDRCISWN